MARFSPEVRNVIALSLAFAQAAARTQSDQHDNLLLSPFNALTALAMVAKAAGGETRAEMAKALFDATPEQLDQAVAGLAALNAKMLAANEGKVTLQTANAVWVNGDQAAINDEYAAALKDSFAAEIAAPAFSNGATVDAMNQWASDNTNGLIKKIIERLSPEDIMVLASALYFKGDWTRKFDRKLTKDAAFTADSGEIGLTKMMAQVFSSHGGLRYQQGRGYEAVALTYGQRDPMNGRSPSMRLVLVRPTDAAVSARDFLAGAPSGWPKWFDDSAFERVIGKVSLPHMDIVQKHDLIPVLQAIGISSAFTAAADFRHMTAEGVHAAIGQVSHDVVFTTNETGSEAAAVTTVGVMRGCVSVPKKVNVAFDRSFILILQDVETGAPLFIGAINKPNTKMQPAAKPTASKRKK